jgi:hypothetical protein
MVVAQQELESQNRRRRARGAESEIVHQQVREQIKPAQAVVAQRREPTHEEIVRKIGEAIGLRGPEEYRVESEVEGMPGFQLTEQEYWDYEQDAARLGKRNSGGRRNRRRSGWRVRDSRNEGVMNGWVVEKIASLPVG